MALKTQGFHLAATKSVSWGLKHYQHEAAFASLTGSAEGHICNPKIAKQKLALVFASKNVGSVTPYQTYRWSQLVINSAFFLTFHDVLYMQPS